MAASSASASASIELRETTPNGISSLPSPEEPFPFSPERTLYDRIQQIAFTRGLKLKAPVAVRSQSLIDFTPIELCWEDLNVEVNIQKGKGKNKDVSSPTTRLILSKCSGYVKPGTMLAIMGASGAGKTTLLNVLSGRSESYSGNMWMNHTPFSTMVLKHSAFVQQADLFFTQLSVYEHLSFQARLRLPSTMSVEEKDERVNAVIHELGLTKVKHNRIGDPGMGGISGGERRRLSVGTEILTNPSLLFVDEPTTGLDSFMAEEVIQMLKNLSNRGRTVVCTIHQPSSDIYALFDNVMYLAEGRVAFFGSLPYAIEYFSRLNFVCPSWSNPSDYFIKLLSVVPARMAESKKQVNMVLDAWEGSKEAWRVHTDIAAINKECDERGMGNLIQREGVLGIGEYNTTWWEQFMALCWRVYVTSRRDPIFFTGRMIQSLVLGVIIGLIYLQAGDGQVSVQNKTGALYFLLMNQATNSIFNVQHYFPPEMAIVKKEYAAGTYRSDVYFLAKTLVVAPMQFLMLFIMTTIAYWMIGMSSSALIWFELMLLMFLCMQSGLSLGYLISCGAPSQNVALAIAPVIIMPVITFGGLTINTNSIPNYFYWLSYSSFAKYGYETAVVLVYSDVESLNCDGSTGSVCRYPNGQSVLTYFGFSSSHTGVNIGALFALTIGIRILAYYFFWRKMRYNPYQRGTIRKANNISPSGDENTMVGKTTDRGWSATASHEREGDTKLPEVMSRSMSFSPTPKAVRFFNDSDSDSEDLSSKERSEHEKANAK